MTADREVECESCGRVETVGLDAHETWDGDPHNWTPTVKAIVDGLVDATATQVVVTITPLSKEET